jgi:hypothetical protein
MRRELLFFPVFLKVFLQVIFPVRTESKYIFYIRIF